MITLRNAAALAAGTALVFAGTAGAAVPKPLPCNLVTDPKGDAGIASGVGNDAVFDLTGADFGSNTKALGITMRLAKAAEKGEVYPTGVKWQTTFTVNGATYFASVVSDGGVAGAFGTTGTGSNTILTTPAAVVDPAKNEVRLVVPFSDFPAAVKAGDVLSGIRVITATTKAFSTPANSGSLGGVSPDNATTESTYKLGTATCVKLPK